MKNKLLPILVLLSLSGTLSAQYQKGVIRLKSGELMQGYIAQDTELELKRRVHFKESLGGTTFQIYSPNEIDGFAFEKGPVYDAILTSYRREEVTFKEKAFAKLVARGAIDLYLSQINVDESEFVFYARKDGRLHQLAEFDQRLYPDGYGYRTRSYYQGILNALTFDCRRRIGAMNDIPFSRREIVRTVDDYNACQDPDYQPMANQYKVAKERRYYVEFFGGPIVARRSIDLFASNERLLQREVFVMFGIAGQIETYKPALSHNLLVHNSLEAYKWITWQESGIVNPPVLSLAYNMSAHYVFSETARVRFFTRLGGTFILDLGRDVVPSPGISLGMGTYFPSGGRLDLQLNAMSILGTEGTTAWRLGYAIPLAREWK